MQELLDTFKEHIFEAICTGVMFIFTGAFRYIWKRVKNDIKDLIDKQEKSLKEIQEKCAWESQEQDYIREGLVSVLHDRLYHACNHFISQGYIEIDDLRNLEYLYRGYHKLGGNGTGTELYNRCRKLRIGEPNSNNISKEE